MASENELRYNLAKAIDQASKFPKPSVMKEILMDAAFYACSKIGVKIKVEDQHVDPSPD